MRNTINDITPPKDTRFLKRYDPQAPRSHRRPRLLRTLLVALAISVFGGGITYGVGLFALKHDSEESGMVITAHLDSAKGALTEFKPSEAQRSFSAIKGELLTLKGKADKLRAFTVANFVGNFVEKAKTIPASFTYLLSLTETASKLTETLSLLKENGTGWFVRNEGTALIETLEILQHNIEKVIEETNALEKGGAEELQDALGDSFLPYRMDFERARSFLDALVNWLKSDSDRHLIVLFQNPSEIRPGGGFIGSYAELDMKSAGLTRLKTWDIYDPDGQLDERVVPPKALQGITPRWGARDANWFFDFPASAETTLGFLEASKIYKEQARTFDGAIAINLQLVESLLEIVGPITLPEYDLVITHENIMEEVQREVEAGEDKAKGEPKRILKFLTPLLMQKLGGLDDEGKRLLVVRMSEHVKNKDMLIYLRDHELQSFLKRLGVGGEVYSLPENMTGDYLAVVKANIAGGKTDAVMKEHFTLHAALREDGLLERTLTIERTHNGGEYKDPWYRAKNTTYFKILTPPSTTLTYAEGNESRTITSPRDYEKEGYIKNPTLESIERTKIALPELGMEEFREFGKKSFAAWSTILKGETKQLTFHYESNLLPPRKDMPTPFTFIFEKQSGISPTLSLVLEAPEGFIWKESGAITFTYENTNPPGRLILNLTLIPS